MALLTKKEIIGAADMPRQTVNVPEWGGDVSVRTLNGFERDQFEISNIGNLANMRARLVALTVVDEMGVRIFSDADVEHLGCKSSAALDRVFEVARKLSGMSKDAEKTAEKNSVKTPLA